jgi:hypothetical protein
MKLNLAKASLLGALLLQVSCTSDVDTFITSLKENDIGAITLLDKSNMQGQTLSISSLAAKKRLYWALKKAVKVNSDSVKPQLHDKFYILSICTKEPDCQEIELVRTTKGEGIIQAHVVSYYLKNNALLQVVDSLFATQKK